MIASIISPKSFLLFTLACTACATSQAQEAKPKESKRVKVETAPVSAVEVPTWATTVGTVRAEKQSDVTASGSGRVLEVLFERGSEVLAGKPLLRLDVRSAALAYAESEAGRTSAKTQKEIADMECSRAETLKKGGALSQQEYERASAQCRSAEDSLRVAMTRVQSASKAVSDGLVRAPFSGRVLERFANVGEFVREDTKIATIGTQGAMKLEFTVAERYLSAVAIGSAVEFSVTAFPAQSRVGKVRIISPAVRETSRDVVVEATVEGEASSQLRAGMFAKVRFANGLAKRASVPATAIRKVEGENHVFVVRGKRAIEQLVQLDDSAPASTLGGQLAVVVGVKEGEQVVISPPESLTNGAEVE
jgi:membrane fusion protein, multidrug efflux system